MNKTEYLLVCLAEEAVEVAHRATKALRFGMQEVQPGQEKTNQQRLCDELIDLLAVCEAIGNLPHSSECDRQGVEQKKQKLQKYMDYSRKLKVLK